MNKPITPEEMKAYVRSTWKKCQAEAQGDGEPVAIGWYIEGFSCVLGPIRPEVRYEEWRPFYALRKPPAQRKPLTDEELIECERLADIRHRKHMGSIRGQQLSPADQFLWHYARAIEAAHGIGKQK